MNEFLTRQTFFDFVCPRCHSFLSRSVTLKLCQSIESSIFNNNSSKKEGGKPNYRACQKPFQMSILVSWYNFWHLHKHKTQPHNKQQPCFLFFLLVPLVTNKQPNIFHFQFTSCFHKKPFFFFWKKVFASTSELTKTAPLCKTTTPNIFQKGENSRTLLQTKFFNHFEERYLKEV